MVTPPFAEEGDLGHFAARPLNPSLGGAQYTLFPSSIAPYTADALIIHNEIFPPNPQLCPTQWDNKIHMEIDSFFEQHSPVVEPEAQSLGPQKEFLNRPSPDPSKEGEGAKSVSTGKSSEGTIPGTKK